MDRIRTMLPLVARMLAGTGIGIVVVIFYFILDYVGSRDKRLYFIDHRDSFIAVLEIGIVIGSIIGIGWAINNKAQNK